MNLRAAWPLLKDTVGNWSKDNTSTLGAALAYYTAFSLAPLLVIAIAIAGLALGQEAAQGLVHREMSSLVGADGAKTVESMIQSARRPAQGVVALVIGTVMLLFGASGVFGQLQSSLNTIWEVAPRPDRGWIGVIKDRFFSFMLVLGTGFLLLVSLVITSAVSAFSDWLGRLMPGLEIVIPALHAVVSFVVITALFAVLFKYVPDVKIRWRDVWIGAVATAVLFLIGKLLLGLYLGRGSFSSSYGAAGSVLVVLLWVYYASQLVFLGAEFTKTYADRYGSRVVPDRGAVPLQEVQVQRGAADERAARRERR
ncbi:MAG: YihY/virulence factor BrkB family protein [Acidobacteria bacterium]|nr:YihY/virulence factor BrkB family protein [Acidobacteriota bacterium]